MNISLPNNPISYKCWNNQPEKCKCDNPTYYRYFGNSDVSQCGACKKIISGREFVIRNGKRP